MKETRKAAILMTLLMICNISVWAQQDNTNGIQAGYFDNSDLSDINYTDFKLPPLAVLFENAKSNPSIELLEKERQIQHALLTKEKKAFLSFFHAHGSYSYGNTSTTSSITDVTTPLYSTTASQNDSHFWNVGASVNIGLETLFDLPGRIRRQKLNEERASLQKTIQYENLKQQIATLYVRITNSLVTLKTAAENAAAYKGAGLLQEQQFKMADIDATGLAETKRWENSAIQTYQGLQSQITTDILVLEILTHTPIITNAITEKQLSEKK